MNSRKTALERAFELASSGKFRTVPKIRHQLGMEGYDPRQLIGYSLGVQLRKMIVESTQGEEQPTLTNDQPPG